MISACGEKINESSLRSSWDAGDLHIWKKPKCKSPPISTSVGNLRIAGENENPSNQRVQNAG